MLASQLWEVETANSLVNLLAYRIEEQKSPTSRARLRSTSKRRRRIALGRCRVGSRLRGHIDGFVERIGAGTNKR